MKKDIRDAVSIIYVFDNKILCIKRQNFLKAFPGYTAFPGGKVDSVDRQCSAFSQTLLSSHPQFLIQTLIRETSEELGFNLLDLIEKNLVKSCDYIGRALTPEFNPYRFNTHFFRIQLDQIPDITPDKNEFFECKWVTPTQILSEYDSGLRFIVPPVRHFIECLKEDLFFQEELSFENRFNDQSEVPYIESIKDIKQIMPRSNTVPPAERTNSFLIGDSIIDPAPKDLDEFICYKKTISKFCFNKIFITHHHRDHHNFAPDLARELHLPLLMSAFTYTRSLEVYGEDYFKNCEIQILKEEDILTTWLGEKVKVIEVPGHDEGQLALMPESKKWFLAGDLFQGIGTVVVGGYEGNMTKYFKTLEKVISLKPNCVIPSHGILLGGTNILEKTLEHRKFREEQILKMHQEGLSVDDMLKAIYFDIPEKVLKYARANIDSHLIKLKGENKI